MAVYKRVILVALFLMSALSLTEAQWGLQGGLNPYQGNAGYSTPLGSGSYQTGYQGNYQSGYQGNYQGGSQGGYQGNYGGPQASAGYQTGYQGYYG